MGISTTLRLAFNTTASTKRAAAPTGGVIPAPTENLASIKTTPLIPVDPELRARLDLGTPYILWQVFTEGGQDIAEGDILVVDSVEYPIHKVADWSHWRPGVTVSHLVVEELKST